MGITRRAFLKGTFQATVAAGVAYPALFEPWQVRVEKVVVPVTGLPAAFVGFRIVQLSDLHYRPYTTLRQIAHAVDLANSLQPDLTVITGDFITRGSGAIAELVPTLSQLRARHGVSSVLGNHDHGSGPERITHLLRAGGLEVLRNQGHEITRDGSSIYLAGVDSLCNGNPNLSAALFRRRGHSSTILLAHEPDFIDLVPDDAGIGLQLSGHSHGGQICLPLLGAPLLPAWGQKYWRGLRKVRQTHVYTNRGIGTMYVPLRLGSIPEVTELTLAAS